MFKVFVFIVILVAFANGAPTPDDVDLIIKDEIKSVDAPALTSTVEATKATTTTTTNLKDDSKDDSKDEVLETAPFIWGSWGYAPRSRYYYPSYNYGYRSYYRPTYYVYKNGWGYNDYW